MATHRYKTLDDISIPGIAAEVKACFELAKMGKLILRLPENIPDLIDSITIDGKPYRELLKFKPGQSDPRGYPDAYFDGQTWDFKISRSRKEDTLRQLIKDGRKADNLIFITNNEQFVSRVRHSIEREIGRRAKNGNWKELPNTFYLIDRCLYLIWSK